MNLKQTIFFNITLSLIFSSVMSFAMLVINAGFIPGFVFEWLKSTGIGFCVSVPLTFLIIRPVQQMAMKLFVSSDDGN